MGKLNPKIRMLHARQKVYSMLLFFALSVVIFAMSSRVVFAAVANGTNNANSGQSIIVKNIAILPFENLSDDPVAPRKVAEILKNELRKKGLVFIATESDVEEFLGKRRIRYTGGVTKLTLREMGKDLGIDAVMVGSINQFSHINGNINVGMTARLLSTINCTILWTDSLSYTNRDFVGFLGLGTIKSIDDLSLRVAGDLIKGIGDHFFIKDEALSPFEIEKVEVYPPVVKGGEKIELRVSVLPITEEPKDIWVVVGNDKARLAKKETNVFEGSLVAPTEEGVYPFSIIATNERLASFSFDAVGKFIIDSTPPMVSLTVDKKVFAPQRKGFVLITPRLVSIDEIEEWAIEIVGQDGKGIRSDKGFGKLPKGLIWRGETDKKNMIEDGEYTFMFSVKDTAGNKTVISDRIRVKNNPPSVKVDVDLKDDKVLFTFNYNHNENIQSWKFSILDKDGKTIRIFDGEGALPPAVEHSLGEGLDVTGMVFTISAVDEAGNSFDMTKSVPSILSKKTPFAKTIVKGQLLEDF